MHAPSTHAPVALRRGEREGFGGDIGRMAARASPVRNEGDALRLGAHLARVRREVHPEGVFQEGPRDRARIDERPLSRHEPASEEAAMGLPFRRHGPSGVDRKDHVDASLPARPRPRIDADLHPHVHVNGIDPRPQRSGSPFPVRAGRKHLAYGIVQPEGLRQASRCVQRQPEDRQQDEAPGRHGADSV